MCCIKERRENQTLHEYIITMVDQGREWRVSFDLNHQLVSCSCRKFEAFGILCCHALKVFGAMEIKLMPSQYVLKRWTKEARSGIIHDVRGREVEGDPKLATTHRYRQICPKLIQLAIEASSNQEAFLFLNKAVDEWSKQIMVICRRQGSVDTNIGDIVMNLNECMA